MIYKNNYKNILIKIYIYYYKYKKTYLKTKINKIQKNKISMILLNNIKKYII